MGSLVLSDPDLRRFLADLTSVSRQILRDTAKAVSGVAEETGEKLAPSGDAVRELQSPSDGKAAPSDGLGSQVAEVAQALEEGSSKVIDEARQSVADNLSGQERATLLARLKKAVSRLQARPHYRSSVDTLADFIKRVAAAYSRVLQTSATTLRDTSGDDALDTAVRNAWSLLKGFGDPTLWKELERRINAVLEHKDSDPDLEGLIADTGRSLATLLTDPTSWDTVEERFEQARERFNSAVRDSSLREDVDALFDVLKRTAESVLEDQDVKSVVKSSTQLIKILSPPGEFVNANLIDDVFIFVPALIKTMQTIPIPRLEISTPEIDLLLENILLTPGRTRNRTFLPLQFKVSTTNDLTVRATRTNAVASTTRSQTTVTLQRPVRRGQGRPVPPARARGAPAPRRRRPPHPRPRRPRRRRRRHLLPAPRLAGPRRHARPRARARAGAQARPPLGRALAGGVAPAPADQAAADEGAEAPDRGRGGAGRARDGPRGGVRAGAAAGGAPGAGAGPGGGLPGRRGAVAGRGRRGGRGCPRADWGGRARGGRVRGGVRAGQRGGDVARRGCGDGRVGGEGREGRVEERRL